MDVLNSLLLKVATVMQALSEVLVRKDEEDSRAITVGLARCTAY